MVYLQVFSFISIGIKKYNEIKGLLIQLINNQVVKQKPIANNAFNSNNINYMAWIIILFGHAIYIYVYKLMRMVNKAY